MHFACPPCLPSTNGLAFAKILAQAGYWAGKRVLGQAGAKRMLK